MQKENPQDSSISSTSHFHPSTEEFTDVIHANHMGKIREINKQTKTKDKGMETCFNFVIDLILVVDMITQLYCLPLCCGI
jgi:hypothetical protein